MSRDVLLTVEDIAGYCCSIVFHDVLSNMDNKENSVSINVKMYFNPFQTNGIFFIATVKPVKNGHSQKDRKLSLYNAGQKYCRMLQGEHSAILLTIIKLLLNKEIPTVRSYYVWY